MVDECPACGLKTDRGESGYAVGSYMFNVVGSELVFVLIVGGVIVNTWPAPPWNVITVAAPFLMLALPPLFYPYCRVLFLGFDLLFNPEPLSS